MTPVGEYERSLARGNGFTRVLAALAVFGALSQALLITGALDANPYTRAPVLDARHFWEWAGRIAGGELTQATPFFSAPLYPYVVGCVRALGGGLAAAAALNGALLVAAAVLVALVGKRLFGPASGALAGALMLVSSDVALETPQVLGGTLQVFLVALTLERATALERTRRPLLGALTLGAASGLLTLAWPAFLVGLPLVAIYAWRILTRTSERAVGLACGAACLASSLLAVAPATVHNYAASGEWIPVSAHAGITFWHGNNPAAQGTLAIVGVENDKDTYHLDALRQARAALGVDAGWRDASRFFFDKGLAWWGEDPLHAGRVALRKLWYALSGRVYADVHPLALEVRDGLVPRHWLAPVPLAWIAPLGLLVSLLLALRRPIATLPLTCVVWLPILVCVAFWYTPRYRLPAAPGLALAAAVAIGWCAGARSAPARSALVATALALGVLSGPLNRARGFDSPEPLERMHLERTAAAFGALGEHARATPLLVRALEREPADADLRRRVFLQLRGLGHEFEAVATLAAAPPETAEDAGYRVYLAWVLATSPDDGARDGARALALIDAVAADRAAEQDPEVHDVRAAALAELRRFPAALEEIERAVQWTPTSDPLRTELELRRAAYRRNEPWREAPLPFGGAQ